MAAILSRGEWVNKHPLARFGEYDMCSNIVIAVMFSIP